MATPRQVNAVNPIDSGLPWTATRLSDDSEGGASPTLRFPGDPSARAEGACGPCGYNGADSTLKEMGVEHMEELARMLATDELTTTKLVDGTGVILDVDTLQVFTLNETGMFLVEALGEGVADREGLINRLLETFEVEEDIAGEDVDLFIADLGKFLVEKRKR